MSNLLWKVWWNGDVFQYEWDLFFFKNQNLLECKEGLLTSTCLYIYIYIFLPLTAETGTATLTLTRRGLYGTIHVPWSSGLPSGSKPEWYTEGQITRSSGSLTIQHGIQSRNFTISVGCFVKIRFFNHEDKNKWGMGDLHHLWIWCRKIYWKIWNIYLYVQQKKY